MEISNALPDFSWFTTIMHYKGVNFSDKTTKLVGGKVSKCFLKIPLTNDMYNILIQFYRKKYFK